MASIRLLKKDIDNQIYEIISDCFIYAGLHPGSSEEEISGIISDAVDLRNELIARVNNPDGKDNPKLVKKHFKAVSDDLVAGVDRFCGRLSSVSKKKKK